MKISHTRGLEFGMQNTWKIFLAVSLIKLLALPARAEVRLPKVLSDHAILQREAPIHIWGWANPGESVSVSLHGQSISTKASEVGLWSVNLAPEGAGGPFQLVVQGENKVIVSDVLVGDLWVASGQSNMEIPLNGYPGHAVIKNSAEEIAQADHPQIRFLRVPAKSSYYPENDVDAAWETCSPQTVGQFSAVAYFFGREIQQQEGVPIGIIDATWGGTPAEAWVSLDTLGSDPSLMPIFAARADMTDRLNDVDLRISEDKREDSTAKAAGLPLPTHDWHPDLVAWEPAGLFNGMIAPLTSYSIKGVIWYQGESNSDLGLATMYQRVFSALIGGWREKWHEGNFPFLFVQLSSFDAKPSENQDWGLIREAQRRALSLANTAMAVSMDVGQADNVHPPDKQSVGHRLALAARALAYNESIEYSGPLFRRAVSEGSAMRVWFDHDKGLASRTPEVEGFEIAGADHHFVSASARIVDRSVVVSSPEVPEPEFVRYGWANYTIASLVNDAGLPGAAFTSEEKLFATLPPHIHF
jgi:sialate O-acetylesterase